MAEPNKTDIAAELTKLQNSYIQKLPSLSQAVRASWQQYQHTPSKTVLDQLYRQIHAIAGTSSVLAVTAVSDTAQQLESLLHQRSTADRLNPDEHSAISRSLNAFLNAVEQEHVEVGNILR